MVAALAAAAARSPGRLSGAGVGAAVVRNTVAQVPFWLALTCCAVLAGSAAGAVADGALRPLRWAHMVYVDKDHDAYAQGQNDYGQLGLGDRVERNGPALVMSGVKSVAWGAYHTLFLTQEGALYAAGRNEFGELGDGTNDDREIPVFVMEGVQEVAAGESHSMLLRSDGAVFAMGRNGNGQLGDGTNIDRSTPVQVGEDATAVGAGWLHSAFLMQNTSVFAMGSNAYGQLGDGTRIQRNRPMEVLASNISDIKVGGFHTTLLQHDGGTQELGLLNWTGSSEEYRIMPPKVLPS